MTIKTKYVEFELNETAKIHNDVCVEFIDDVMFVMKKNYVMEIKHSVMIKYIGFVEETIIMIDVDNVGYWLDDDNKCFIEAFKYKIIEFTTAGSVSMFRTENKKVFHIKIDENDEVNKFEIIKISGVKYDRARNRASFMNVYLNDNSFVLDLTNV